MYFHKMSYFCLFLPCFSDVMGKSIADVVNATNT